MARAHNIGSKYWHKPSSFKCYLDKYKRTNFEFCRCFDFIITILMKKILSLALFTNEKDGHYKVIAETNDIA